ncbi:MAG: hypothetical protein ACRDBG_23575, partial [Waterburya sp.]
MHSQPNQSLAGSAASLQNIAQDYTLLPSTLWAKLDPKWMPAAWLKHLSIEIFQSVMRGMIQGESNGLLISAPPRHGKSRFATTAVPTWFLEKFPWARVAVTTYGDDLSRDFTGTIRDTIKDNPELVSVRLSKDQKSVSDWRTDAGGGVYGTGVGGPLTGKGYHLIIIDDYIKNFDEASSPAHLER